MCPLLSEAVAEGARRATGGTASLGAPHDGSGGRGHRQAAANSLEARSVGCWPKPIAPGRPARWVHFLRRERIYSSMLSSWRKQMDASERVALSPKKRGDRSLIP